MTPAASSTIDTARQAIAANDWKSARQICKRLLADSPVCADATYLLAMALCGDGETDAALPYLQRAAELAPSARHHRNLGVLYASLNRWQDALSAFEQSLALDPDHPDTVAYYGRALCETQQHEAAVKLLRSAIASTPEHLGIRTELAIALVDARHLEETRSLLVGVLEESPEAVRARRYLIQVCVDMRRLDEAVHHCHLLTQADDSSSSWARLAVVSWSHGDLSTALRARDEALRRGITDPNLHSGMLYLSQFDAAQTPASLYRAHRLWAITHTRVARRTWASTRDPARKLRVGYVGMGFFTTPGRYFRLPLLENADRNQHDLVFYDTEPDHDPALLDGLTAYRDISRLTDTEAAAAICDDAIDVLVDFGGHGRSSRPGIFALRPAPLQVGYSGYPCTTGLRTFNALLTDAVLSPPGSGADYSETLRRLPHGSIMFPARDAAPDLTPLPALRNGYVTFGMFQRAAKLSPECYDLFARVLHEIPDSRLLIHHTDRDFDDPRSAAVLRVLDAFAARDIDSTRLQFVGLRLWPAHMQILAESDIALDTFPFNGQTTTCECLWMGVPVVTLLGGTQVGRVGASLLHQAGVPDWIAPTPDEYLSIVAALANGLERLTRLRLTLRGDVARSRLCDTVGRTREIEAVYRDLWRAYCAES